MALGVHMEAMCHTQSQLHRDGQTGSGQQGDRKQTRETQTQTSPQATPHSVSVPPPSTLPVLHLPSDSNKHSDQVYFIDFHHRGKVQAPDNKICDQRNVKNYYK